MTDQQAGVELRVKRNCRDAVKINSAQSGWAY